MTCVVFVLSWFQGDNFQINVINQLNDTDGLDVYTTIVRLPCHGTEETEYLSS